MQSSEKYEQFNKILCNKHNKKIVGVVIDNPVQNKLACLNCAQDQKVLINRIFDKDDFIKLIEKKITYLTTIQQQWIQLSKQFEQFLQNQIIKLSIDFKDKQELNDLIDAYDITNNKDIQNCLGEIQKLVQELQGTQIQQKVEANPNPDQTNSIIPSQPYQKSTSPPRLFTWPMLWFKKK